MAAGQKYKSDEELANFDGFSEDDARAAMAIHQDDGFYMVMDGQCEVIHHDGYVAKTLHQGDFFGDISNFSEENKKDDQLPLPAILHALLNPGTSLPSHPRFAGKQTNDPLRTWWRGVRKEC